MNKQILEDYIDACALIEETEKDIERLNKRKRTMIQTNVKGSNPEFPYQPQHFRVAGCIFSYSDDTQLRYEEKLLKERKEKAEGIKLQAESVMNTAPVRIQRIIRMRYFEGKTWEEAAYQLGRKATADSIRKELKRFLEKDKGLSIDNNKNV